MPDISLGLGPPLSVVVRLRRSSKRCPSDRFRRWRRERVQREDTTTSPERAGRSRNFYGPRSGFARLRRALSQCVPLAPGEMLPIARRIETIGFGHGPEVKEQPDLEAGCLQVVLWLAHGGDGQRRGGFHFHDHFAFDQQIESLPRDLLALVRSADGLNGCVERQSGKSRTNRECSLIDSGTVWCGPASSQFLPLVPDLRHSRTGPVGGRDRPSRKNAASSARPRRPDF